MFANNKNNNFRFSFPKSLIPDTIIKKYKTYLNRISGNMIQEPIDVLNYTIQNINLPGLEYDAVEQIDNPGIARRHRSSLPIESSFENTFTVTLKHLDGWITYWMCMELFTYYYNLDGSSKNQYLPNGFFIQTLDLEGNSLVKINMENILFTGLSAIDLSFASNTIEMNTFDLTFTYDRLKIQLELQ